MMSFEFFMAAATAELSRWLCALCHSLTRLSTNAIAVSAGRYSVVALARGSCSYGHITRTIQLIANNAESRPTRLSNHGR